MLTVNTPNVSVTTNYTFSVDTQIGVDSTKYQKPIYLQVIPEISSSTSSPSESENQTSSNDTIDTPTDNTNIPTDTTNTPADISDTPTDVQPEISTETKAMTYTTQGIAGAGTVAVTAVSIMNLSSPQGLWLMVNQIQLCMLLLLTGAYIPKDVVDYLSGSSFSLFSMDFLPFHKQLLVKGLYSWVAQDQENEILQKMGLKSGSTIYNNLSLFFMVFLLIVMHLLIFVITIIVKHSTNSKR